MNVRLAALSALAACLCAPQAAAQNSASDPYESANRRVFASHEAIDKAVMEPVARGYRAITPRPLRTGVSNFLRNLRSPVIFANDVLQAEPRRAGATLARFGINSTIGVLGLFDPADGMGIERHDEDFGQTLAVWGVPEGPYLFVPLIGPANVRDGVGHIVDLAFNPLNWADFDSANDVRAGRLVLTALSAREGLLDQVDRLREDSLDPYVTIRSSYELIRESAIRNGRADVQDLPEFEAIPEDQGTSPAPVAPDTQSMGNEPPVPSTPPDPSPH